MSVTSDESVSPPSRIGGLGEIFVSVCVIYMDLAFGGEHDRAIG